VSKREGDKYPRDPNGWYVETRACVRQVARVISFAASGTPDLIWDPACGGGTIPDVMSELGHEAIGSDIIERRRWGRQPYTFFRRNYLTSTRYPIRHDRALSVFCNPPYNEPEVGIAERFIHHTLDHVPFNRAAFIVPIEFACGQGRYERLYSKRQPSHVLFFMERPSMPPGQQLLDHGEDARGGGMQDYVCVVWTAGGPHRTEAIFVPPDSAPAPKSDRRIRRGARR